jgi:hypothetical protein
MARTGFDSRDVLVMDVSLPKEKYPGGNDGLRVARAARGERRSDGGPQMRMM